MKDFFPRAGPRRGHSDGTSSTFRDSLSALRGRLRDGLAEAASRAVALAVRRAASCLLGGEDDDDASARPIALHREYGRGEWDDDYGHDPDGWGDSWRPRPLGWDDVERQREDDDVVGVPAEEGLKGAAAAPARAAGGAPANGAVQGVRLELMPNAELQKAVRQAAAPAEPPPPRKDDDEEQPRKPGGSLLSRAWGRVCSAARA